MKIFKIFAVFVVTLMATNLYALTDGEKDAITLLVSGPKDNPVRECVISGLGIAHGVTLQKLGKMSDDDIAASLQHQEGSAGVKELRQRQAEEWRRSQRPGALATMSFDYCMSTKNVNLSLGLAGTTCFSMTGIASYVEALKLTNVPRDKAIIQAQAAYGMKLPVDYIANVAKAAYDGDPQADNYKVARQVFVECVRNTVDNKTTAEWVK